MSDIRCPLPNCSFSTGAVDAQVAASLLNLHATTHAQAQALAPAAVQIACPLEGCTYTANAADSTLAASLLNLHARAHQHDNQSSHMAKVEKVKRPTVSSGGTDEEWKYFTTRWTEYVKATGVSGTDRVSQLLECCDETLRKDITRTAGGSLTDKTEQEVLTAMRALAVREENAMVARVALHNMRQDRDEPVRSFCARVKGQASVCRYSVCCPNCSADVDYTPHVVRDVISRGISDGDIQLELLGHTDQDMTLEKVVAFIESKESGKRSALKLSLSQSSGAQAARSSYKQSKRPDRKAPKNPAMPCGYCGKPGHAGEVAKVRQQVCPAYNHCCARCGKYHHHEDVCRGDKPRPQRAPRGRTPPQQEGAIFDSEDIFETGGRPTAWGGSVFSMKYS